MGLPEVGWFCATMTQVSAPRPVPGPGYGPEFGPGFGPYIQPVCDLQSAILFIVRYSVIQDMFLVSSVTNLCINIILVKYKL